MQITPKVLEISKVISTVTNVVWIKQQLFLGLYNSQINTQINIHFILFDFASNIYILPVYQFQKI